MNAPRPDRPTAGVAPLLVALVLVAMSLRPQIAAIGPLAPGIRDELGASHGVVGLLTAIPVLCMGLFAPFGPSIARLVGTRAGIAVSVGLLVTSAILRAILPGAPALVVTTFGIGIGTAIVGPILPMFVRGRLPGHVVGGTSSYAAGTILGAAIAAAAAVPLATVTWGWRGSLLVLSVASAGTVLAWLGLVGRPPRSDEAPVAATARAWTMPSLPLRRPVAWAIGVLLGLQSCLYYGVTAWLASVYIERGWTPATAALLLATVSAVSLFAIVLVPFASRRGLSRRVLLMASSGMTCVGLLGVAVLPDGAFLWATLMGFGLGMTFTLILTLPADIGGDARETGGAAALMLLVGYLIASVAPFVLGAVRDATGDFGASVWLLVGIAALMVPLAWSLAPHRLRPHVGTA